MVIKYTKSNGKPTESSLVVHKPVPKISAIGDLARSINDLVKELEPFTIKFMLSITKMMVFTRTSSLI
jgi:hypothetical protein